jgi:hypothetical protein
MNPPTDVTPYNATFNGNFTDLNPGSNYSYYYQYGDCTGFPTGASTTPVATVSNAAANGTVPSATVGGLQPSTNYCARLCIQDDTAGSGYICTVPPQSFTTPAPPAVETNPPYYVGKSSSPSRYA